MDRRLADAYRECAHRTRAAASNFYYAFLTLPPQKRRAINAIYTFCRAADDVADSSSPVNEKKAKLAALRARLKKAATGTPEVEVDLALADTIARFSVNPDDLSAVIDGVEMDLVKSRYKTFAELTEYCYRVAAAVGLSVLPVLNGGPVEAKIRTRGIALGIGLQLANIVRDVREDADRDRIYLPEEDLNQFNVQEKEILAGEWSTRMQALLAFEANRARDRIADGLKLIPALPHHARPFPLFLARVYGGILDRIEAQNYDVFSGRVSLTTSTKLFLLVRTFVTAFLGKG